MRHFRLLLTLLLWTLATQACYGEVSASAGWDTVSRVFQKRCINCHSQFGAAKALRLDSYEGVTTGSANGAVVLSGNSSQSELVRRLRGESTPRMPFSQHATAGKRNRSDHTLDRCRIAGHFTIGVMYRGRLGDGGRRCISPQRPHYLLARNQGANAPPGRARPPPGRALCRISSRTAPGAVGP